MPLVVALVVVLAVVPVLEPAAVAPSDELELHPSAQANESDRMPPHTLTVL